MRPPRIEQLADVIRHQCQVHQEALALLPTEDDKGRTNGFFVPGWECVRSNIIAEAARRANAPMLLYWRGLTSVAARRALPSLIMPAVIVAYYDLFEY
jgi:hypothetical protein